MPHAPASPITAIAVPQHRRLAFSPLLFGPHRFLEGERLVYDWLDRLCPRYDGGYWHFVELSNGSGYLAPDQAAPMDLEVRGNGYRGRLSADAAGITATLLALRQLAECADGDEVGDVPVNRYLGLRTFAREHAESVAILAAIS
jgi:hypothetical protein